MDWEAEYSHSKARRTGLVAERSYSRKNDNNDDELMFNNIDGDVGRNDSRRRADKDVGLDNGGNTRERFESEEEPKETPLEQLTRHWMNERHAPDILSAQENLLAQLLDHLRRQVGLSPSSLIISD